MTNPQAQSSAAQPPKFGIKQAMLSSTVGLIAGVTVTLLFKSLFATSSEDHKIPASVADFATTDAAVALARKLADDEHEDWPLELAGINVIPEPENIQIVREGLMAGKRDASGCLVHLTDASTAGDYQVALALAKGEPRAVCVPPDFQHLPDGKAFFQLDSQGALPSEVRVAGIRFDPARMTLG